jgi:hypothetical protein
MRKIFDFKRILSYGDIIALVALIIGLINIYNSCNQNKSKIDFSYDSYKIGIIKNHRNDKNYILIYNTFYLNNTGNKLISFNGFKKSENLSFVSKIKNNIVVSDFGCNYWFYIFDFSFYDVMNNYYSNILDSPLDKEKLSNLNLKIEQGERKTLNLGIVIDCIDSNGGLKVENILNSVKLEFSNGQEEYYQKNINLIPSNIFNNYK